MELDKEKILKELRVDEEFLKRLFGIFFKTIETSIRDIHAAIANEDFEAIEDIGHMIKGSAANLRLPMIEGTARAIEKEVKETKNRETLTVLLKQLESESQGVRAIAQTWWPS